MPPGRKRRLAVAQPRKRLVLPGGTPYPKDSARTPTELFERLHDMFGFGDWSEEDGEPYWRWQMREVGIMKRVLASKKVDPWDVHLAGRYARWRGYPVQHWTWLLKYIPDARRWWAAKSAIREAEDFESRWADALRWEMETDPDGVWAARLVRATDRREVFEQWRAERSRSALQG